MYVENIWGIFFCMYIPMVIVTILAYLEGREEGKRYGKTNRLQYRKNNSRGNYVKRKTTRKY